VKDLEIELLEGITNTYTDEENWQQKRATMEWHIHLLYRQEIENGKSEKFIFYLHS